MDGLPQRRAHPRAVARRPGGRAHQPHPRSPVGRGAGERPQGATPPAAEMQREAGTTLAPGEATSAEKPVNLVDGLGLSTWWVYTIKGERTRAGQSWAEAFAVAADVLEIVAVGVSCCVPPDATAAVPMAREVTSEPVIVHPNSGAGGTISHTSGSGRPGSSATVSTCGGSGGPYCRWRLPGASVGHLSSRSCGGQQGLAVVGWEVGDAQVGVT
ncbi:homocysteine S-methyltransferase family protein [Lipingzhangella rawalii]|uniref:homocysteine S-methyltransferase family protein n=1 Tax=Lipingzhangella rawalii TaxID=2055835 RepID=UPI00389908AD